MFSGISILPGYSAIARFSELAAPSSNYSVFGGRGSSGQRFYTMAHYSFGGDVHAYGYGELFTKAPRINGGVIALCGGVGYVNGAFDMDTGGVLTEAVPFYIGVEGEHGWF
jgi:hypothetical protein